MHHFSWGPTDFSFLACKSHKCSFFLGNSISITQERNQVFMGKLLNFLHSNNKTEEQPLKKIPVPRPISAVHFKIISIHQPLCHFQQIFFFSKLNRMAYLLQNCPVKSKLLTNLSALQLCRQEKFRGQKVLYFSSGYKIRYP